MQTELPDTILKAWGPEVAKDFITWLEERLGATGFISNVQISAFVVRQKVNVLMLEQVSNLLLAGNPVLVQTSDEVWVWRVPVDLTFPSRGRVGCVGEVEVDARYGEVRYTETLLAQIADKARQLAQQILHPATIWQIFYRYLIFNNQGMDIACRQDGLSLAIGALFY